MVRALQFFAVASRSGNKSAVPMSTDIQQCREFSVEVPYDDRNSAYLYGQILTRFFDGRGQPDQLPGRFKDVLILPC
jgi:hypothetical protein